MNLILINEVLIVTIICIICNLFLGYLRGGVKTIWMKIFYIHLSIPVIYYLRHNLFILDFGWVPFFFFLSLGTQKVAIIIRKKCA